MISCVMHGSRKFSKIVYALSSVFKLKILNWLWISMLELRYKASRSLTQAEIAEIVKEIHLELQHIVLM